MSNENLEKRCGSCEFKESLPAMKFIAINRTTAEMQGGLYTHTCTHHPGLLITVTDLPFTTRFLEDAFPNQEAESCHSSVNRLIARY